MTELLHYFNSSNKRIKHDYHSGALLLSLKQIMDFKMQNDMLNFKTYVSILETDLCTSVKNDPLKVFDHTYSTFLQDNLE